VKDLLADLNQVRDRVRPLRRARRTGAVPPGRLRGNPSPTLRSGRSHCLRIGAGAGAGAGVVLDQLYDRVVEGGFRSSSRTRPPPACREAIDDFRARRGITGPRERGRLVGRSVAQAGRGPAPRIAPSVQGPALARAPLAPPTPVDAIDLSVVVVIYKHAPRSRAHVAFALRARTSRASTKPRLRG